ncbi:MAG: HNH endonuclease [Gammaproteobacteria bacterium]|nr:HNH endonuclease [Gammaproteobacteria bacterium]
MASVKNRHGLSRYIPSSVKLQVRQRSKFGCVICRNGIYEYEHIVPFQNCEEHDPDKICLLCAHCHGKVTRGLTSKEIVIEKYKEVQQADIVKSPFDEFSFRAQNIDVHLGSSRFSNCKNLIMLGEEELLVIEAPEEGSTYPQITAMFTDDKSKQIFRINRNQWSGSNRVWDAQVIGTEIKIFRLSDKKIALHIEVLHPNIFKIISLDMYYKQFHLFLSKDFMNVGRISPDLEVHLGFESLISTGASIGILVDTKIPHVPSTKINLGGERGIELVGSGVHLSMDSIAQTIKGLRYEYADREKTITYEHSLLSTIEKPKVRLLPSRL